jgi:hypothetical protein
VRHAVFFYGLFERGGDMLLAHDIVEGERPVFSRKNQITHKAFFNKGSSLPAAHSVSIYRCSLPGLAGFTD